MISFGADFVTNRVSPDSKIRRDLVRGWWQTLGNSYRWGLPVSTDLYHYIHRYFSRDDFQYRTDHIDDTSMYVWHVTNKEIHSRARTGSHRFF